jgi:hypothetical protein
MKAKKEEIIAGVTSQCHANRKTRVSKGKKVDGQPARHGLQSDRPKVADTLRMILHPK